MTTTTKKEYWYPTAFSHWGEEEHAAMARVIESGRFTMGEETEAFEAELAAFNQRKHAICVNSGSSANLIAVAAMVTLEKVINSEAIVPALAWGTTYAPLLQYGFNLSLNDCNSTWCPATIFSTSWENDEALIVACSILGNPADRLILEGSDLNDDCEALGATCDGKPTASYGGIATQSFFYSHQLSAIEGGAMLTDDDDIARTCRMLRDHGLTRSLGRAVPFDHEYEFQLFGYNVRPLEMHMAIAREQLKKVPLFRTARKKNWNTFVRALGTDPKVKMPTMMEGANPFGIHFEFETIDQRRVVAKVLRDHGIDCRLPTGGSFRLHPYGRPWKEQKTPRADKIHTTGMFIGNAPYDITEKVEQAATLIKEVLE